MHAASLGEVNAVSGLLKLVKESLKAPVLLTCTTAAGRAKALADADAAAFAPLDLSVCVRRFLRKAKPRALILVETELWPNMILAASEAGIPIMLVNGRVSDKSHRRYRWIRPLLKDLLKRLDCVLAQTEEDARRFADLGAAKAAAAGNLKYDLPAPRDAAKQAAGRLKSLGWSSRQIFLAASTRPGEERPVLEAFLKARDRVPIPGLVIAPRHWERVQSLIEVVRRMELRYGLWSKEKTAPEADVLVLDRPGALPLFFEHARATFVGGTLAPVGGHNLLEPAAAGSPVLFGPHTFHTREPAEALKLSGGGLEVADSAELQAALERLFSDQAARDQMGAKALRTAKSFQGATKRIFERIRPFLK